jgi:hypothetical protein
MNVFTIDADNNITVHPNRKIARRTGGGAFDTAENFAELIGADNKRLIGIWNGLTGIRPVKKFTSGAVAARRIFAELQKLAAPADPTAAAPRGKSASEPTRWPQAATAAEPKASSRKSAGKAVKTTRPDTKRGTRRDILFGLISRENGASLEELMAALGWQKHSVRGFIATLGKTVSIESFKTEQGVRTYKTS